MGGRGRWFESNLVELHASEMAYTLGSYPRNTSWFDSEGEQLDSTNRPDV